MKIAFVYDRVNKIGGAERVLVALHEIWPDAPLYTAVYNPETALWAKDFKIIPSFLQKFPFAKTHHELYPWLTPLAFETFDFTGFDIVISITSAEAKGIITKPGTLHICYCLTPTRYLWNGYQDYHVPMIVRSMMTKLRIWDQIASQRPDYYFAISETVKQRIWKYYRRKSEVIFPPVDTTKFVIRNPKSEKYSSFSRPTSNFYLVVSRLVSYKQIDLAIEAFNKLDWPLKIVGVGREMNKLRAMAKPNIEFLGQLTDKELLGYYKKCQAVIFPQEEDFGLVPLEAQACGKPVIAYRGGGALETIIEGKTGIFFKEQTAESLLEALGEMGKTSLQDKGEKGFRPEDCRKQAEKFSQEIFKKKFKQKIEEEWKKYKTNISTS